MANQPLLPPRCLTAEGSPRRVGVEIEFNGPGCAAAAALVVQLFGGRSEQIDQHSYQVRESAIGDVTVALDMMAAHSDKKQTETLADRVEQMARAALGDIGSLIMPLEVSTAPLEIAQLVEADRLAAALRRSGGVGTYGSPIYAYGLHLNPEIAAPDAGYLVSHLKAYVLCAPWLRAEIEVDISRRISGYIERYPDFYVCRLVDPHYQPDLAQLIDEYIAANPTRNRDLDMLPVFAYLDPARVFARVEDKHIKPRPAFHYRLPNSGLDDPDWSVVNEWNRWVVVERLAADPARLAALGRAYLEQPEEGGGPRWVATVKSWIGAA